MKNKLFTLLSFMFLLNINTFSQKLYSIEQVKDTLIKYPNAFEAFSKLRTHYIPIKEFRQDSFLMGKAYNLLDKKYSLQLSFRNYKNSELKYINKYDQDKKRYVSNFLKKTRSYSNKQINLFLDSIFKNDELLKTYLDSSEKFQFKLDSLDFLSYDKWQSPYVTFHSRLMTQRSYDTIRAYYDRYYKNFNEDAYFGFKAYDNDVIIALINMGDPELCTKYDIWFDKKLKKHEIKLNEYLFLTKFIKGSFEYRQLAKLLFYDYLIVEASDGVGTPINGTVVFNYFPTADTLDVNAQNKIVDKMIGNIFDCFSEDKNGNITYKYKSSYEEFHEYFLQYADYLEQKEKILRNQIKYKTSEK